MKSLQVRMEEMHRASSPEPLQRIDVKQRLYQGLW